MKPISEDFQSVIPTIHIDGAAKAIELYKEAFGAEEKHRLNCPKTGRIIHCALKIGNSNIFISDAIEEMMATPSKDLKFYLYVPNADKAIERAKKAGCSEMMPATDMFWGDRMGAVTDKYGFKWSIAHHVKDVSKEDMEAAMKDWIESRAA